jgi:hypothetical protein
MEKVEYKELKKLIIQRPWEDQLIDPYCPILSTKPVSHWSII